MHSVHYVFILRKVELRSTDLTLKHIKPVPDFLDWFQSILHFLSVFIISCSCVCLFNPFLLFYCRNSLHLFLYCFFIIYITSCSCICLFNPCFTAETTLSFPLRDITFKIIISCTHHENMPTILTTLNPTFI